MVTFSVLNDGPTELPKAHGKRLHLAIFSLVIGLEMLQVRADEISDAARPLLAKALDEVSSALYGAGHGLPDDSESAIKDRAVQVSEAVFGKEAGDKVLSEFGTTRAVFNKICPAVFGPNGCR